MIKARYFPHCSFWEARKGGRASWASASLLSVRDVLRKGSHWQIMGGQDVKVWSDRWLPSIPLGHPLPQGQLTVSPNLRVSSLICPVSGCWDISFLQSFLFDTDKRAIEATPIGVLGRRDRLVWAPNRKGIYTVKSGYIWLINGLLEDGGFGPSISIQFPPNFWNHFWKLGVPPKIRHLFWLSVHNGLPSCVNLFRRKSAPSPVCPICLGQDESLEHIFLLCKWVRPIWFGGALSYRVDSDALSSWAGWCKIMFAPSFGSASSRSWVQSYLAFTCWFIWKAHCEYVFNKVPLNPVVVLLKIANALSSF